MLDRRNAMAVLGVLLAGCATPSTPAVPAPPPRPRPAVAPAASEAPPRRLSILERRTVSPHPVTVLLSITAQGCRVRGRAAALSPAELARVDRFFPSVGGKLDGKALNDYLYELKQRYPHSRQLNIYARPDTPYKTLVAAMYAARERVLHDQGGARVELFPEVVFVSTQTP